MAGVTTGYILDDRSPTGYVQVLDEVQGPSITRSYVYGQELIEQDRINTTTLHQSTSYNVYDGHGSVRALTELTGAVTDTYDYDAFGNIVHSTGTTPNVYLYSGEQFDPDLHLYYNRARYLNTSTGRFWTMDTDDGNDYEPLSLHKYLYSGADPINQSDPSGNDFDLGSIAVSTGIYGTIGAISGITINGVSNYIQGQPIFQGAGGAAAFGAASLPLAAAFPLVGLVLGGLGIAGAGVTAWNTFTSTSASGGAKGCRCVLGWSVNTWSLRRHIQRYRSKSLDKC